MGRDHARGAARDAPEAEDRVIAAAVQIAAGGLLLAGFAALAVRQLAHLDTREDR